MNVDRNGRHAHRMVSDTGSVINKTGCKAGTTAKGQTFKLANISTIEILPNLINLPFCRCASRFVLAALRKAFSI